eukprot:1360650-Prorocentrum_lima.AAC.1
MPFEAKTFENVCRLWMSVTESARSRPNVTKFASDKVYSNLKICSDYLEMIERGLHDYMDAKRS